MTLNLPSLLVLANCLTSFSLNRTQKLLSLDLKWSENERPFAYPEILLNVRIINTLFLRRFESGFT